MPPLLGIGQTHEPPDLLVLARHGLSLTNALRYMHMYLPEEADTTALRCYNDLTVPLMPEGKAQAHALGRMLIREFGMFDVVCFSYHTRSIHTWYSASDAWPPDANVEEFQHCFFNERDNGYLFGMKLSELEAAYGKAFMDAHRAYWKRAGWFHGRPFGGESIADLVFGRTHHALELIKQRFSRKRVLVIGHGTWIRAARVLLEGHPTNTLHTTFPGLDNCGFVAYWPNADNELVFKRYQYSTEREHPPIPPD